MALIIVFEGPDGVGKGEQVRRLVERLKDRGFNVWKTREPTDGVYGQWIRRVLDKQEPMPSPTKFQLGYTEDREEHVPEILAALARGELVVCDRYYYSTLAYGKASGADMEILREANSHFPAPDLMLWLNLDSTEARRRMEQRGGLDEHDKNLQFQEKLRLAYLELIAECPEAVEIDASGASDEVHRRVWKEVEKILPKVA